MPEFWVATHHQCREFLCSSDIILQGIQQGWCCKNYVACFSQAKYFQNIELEGFLLEYTNIRKN